MTFPGNGCLEDQFTGHTARNKDFRFDPNYTPLNHGSYGAFPTVVRDYQRGLQDAIEARADPFIRFEIPTLLHKSRLAAAELLGTSPDEVVLVPNVTTAINTVLRNLRYEMGDVILYFPTTYPACQKTIEYICETTLAQSCCVDMVFPIEDEELLEKFRQAVTGLSNKGLNAKLALFDTVVTFPGVRMPWEQLTQSCRALNVLSLVDGAHGIGHIDLKDLGAVGPDFFASNCYKWLYTPRPSAVFYVPRRNQHWIRTTLPTSSSFQPAKEIENTDGLTSVKDDCNGFVDLFKWASTVDQTPYLCIPKAIETRQSAYGGEDAIRRYCFGLANAGGELVAQILGTEIMSNSTGSINQCCFTNVRLPLTFISKKGDESDSSAGLMSDDGPTIMKWLTEHSLWDHNTWMPGKFYAGQGWVRLSAQIYLEVKDFLFAAHVLVKLCEDVKAGAWKL